MLDVESIRLALSRSLVGGRISYIPRVDSTNRLARDLLTSGLHRPLLVLTDFQEQGRGRRGRKWVAPPGTSVLLSMVVEQPPRVLSSDLVLSAALAVGRAVSAVTGLNSTLKWPNDVLAGDRKYCGILTETVNTGNGLWAIVGTGINGNFDPHGVDGVPVSATTLKNELGVAVSREALVVAFVEQYELLLHSLSADPDRAFREWRDALQTRGRAVTVYDAECIWNGRALDVRRDGGLVVEDEAGTTRVVYAADVTIREA